MILYARLLEVEKLEADGRRYDGIIIHLTFSKLSCVEDDANGLTDR